MVGPRAVPLALAATLLAWPAGASFLEEASNGAIAYQFDADQHHDAPDACVDADPRWSLPLQGQADGLVVPPDDLADAYVLDVPAGAVGSRLTLRVTEPSGTVDVDLMAFAPGCQGTVLDAVNQPVPFPAPPEPADGERQATLGPHATPLRCDDHWAFVATRLGGLAPPRSLHAAWTDGSEATVPLAFANRDVALYLAQPSVAFTLTGAWINLPAAWDGDFALGLSPCDARDGGAVYGEPALLADDLLAFTPIRAGPHVVVVGVGRPALDPPPDQVPFSCHMCVEGTEEAAEKTGYVVSSGDERRAH